MTIKCEGCGKEYFPNQSWIHKHCAINSVAINGAINRESDNQSDHAGVGKEAEGPAFGEGVESPVCDKTPNRRGRKAYNEYMSEYMRTYRARKMNPT
jgi:hypothetical protein